MKSLLDTIASVIQTDQSQHDLIINYVNMAVTKAMDAETVLNEMETVSKQYINAFEDFVHALRSHPMHRLNKISQSALYSLDETVEMLKLDRQKVIKMIHKGTLHAAQDGRKFLPYRWSVDNFIYNSSVTLAPQPGHSSSTWVKSNGQKTPNKTGNPFSLDSFFE
ncbi:helix-turn-helix domain-containing protein [Rufibacter immobilis]|uniref:helix-turn-helix domain-containing protein n=1 Tax=Rufibacter immobilis TaxID=1348778 RepID=UPI0035E6FD5A